MPSGIYDRKTNPKCNKCGIYPKYPRQGLCKKSLFEKNHNNWVASRPKKIAIISFEGELWKDLKEAPGYQISSFGRVKSLNYYEESGREAILKLRKARKNSYYKADIDKYNIRPSVHRLVGIYFLPNPNNYPNVLHKDGDKQNNHVDNLYWGNQSMNMKDYSNYRIQNNISHKKINSKQAVLIYNSKENIQTICDKFNVSATIVWQIKKGRRWSSVTGAKNNDERKNKIK